MDAWACQGTVNGMLLIPHIPNMVLLGHVQAAAHHIVTTMAITMHLRALENPIDLDIRKLMLPIPMDVSNAMECFQDF